MRNALIPIMAIALTGCLPNTNSNQVSTSGATQADPITVPKNSNGLTVEQQNIQDRIRVTTDPTKVLWIHLIALDGKILKRMPVRNKVTSSGKRLEPKTTVGTASDGRTWPRFNGWETSELIQPDGTYGESDQYNYWFDTMGRYHQWGTAGGLGYLVTDYPIDLENPSDKITGMYNAHQAASAWQAEQEARMKAARSR